MTLRLRLHLARKRLAPIAPVALIGGLLAFVPYPTCLVKLALGVPCPGCGMTRATLHLLRGHLWQSLRLHPAALPSALGLVAATALALALPADHPSWERFVRASMTALAVALFGAWALRLAGLLPPV